MSDDCTARDYPADLKGWIGEINIRGQLQLSVSAQEKLYFYCQIIRQWNQRLNLTSIIDDEGMAVRHILDSLMLLPWLDELLLTRAKVFLADIGTGAGFPGIPLKIARPELDVLLLDSLGKRVKFLREVIEKLDLSTIKAIHSRAEDAAHVLDLREKFSVVTARAVAPLPVLAEYCLPFVEPGGLFIALKGNLASEWPSGKKAVTILGGKIKHVAEFSLPGTSMHRSLLIIEKIKPAPPAYPRKAGRPEKNPL